MINFKIIILILFCLIFMSLYTLFKKKNIREDFNSKCFSGNEVLRKKCCETGLNNNGAFCWNSFEKPDYCCEPNELGRYARYYWASMGGGAPVPKNDKGEPCFSGNFKEEKCCSEGQVINNDKLTSCWGTFGDLGTFTEEKCCADWKQKNEGKTTPIGPTGPPIGPSTGPTGPTEPPIGPSTGPTEPPIGPSTGPLGPTTTTTASMGGGAPVPKNDKGEPCFSGNFKEEKCCSEGQVINNDKLTSCWGTFGDLGTFTEEKCCADWKQKNEGKTTPIGPTGPPIGTSTGPTEPPIGPSTGPIGPTTTTTKVKDPSCFYGEFTEESCCESGLTTGNKLCWDKVYTPQNCCSAPTQKAAYPKDPKCFNKNYRYDTCCETGLAKDGSTCWGNGYTHERCCNNPKPTPALSPPVLLPVTPPVSPPISPPSTPSFTPTTGTPSSHAGGTGGLSPLAPLDSVDNDKNKICKGLDWGENTWNDVDYSYDGKILNSETNLKLGLGFGVENGIEYKCKNCCVPPYTHNRAADGNKCFIGEYKMEDHCINAVERMAKRQDGRNNDNSKWDHW